MDNLDSFEKILKDKLEQQQYAYDPSQWNAIEKQLPPPKQGTPPWKYIAAASAIVAGGLLIWQLTGTESTPLANNTKENNPENTSVVNDADVANANNPAVIEVTPNNDELIIVNDYPANSSPDQNNVIHDDPNPSPDVDPKIDLANSDPKKSDHIEPGQNDPELDPNLNKPEEVIVPQPSAQFALTKAVVCTGETIEFNALNKIDNTDYLWDFGDGEYSKMKSPGHSFNEEGVYYVSLEARSTLDNSIVSKSDKIAITVNATPDVAFSWEEDNSEVIPKVRFINRTDNAVNWSWNLGNGEISDEKDPTITYKKKGYYNITLTATNAAGCTKVSQQEIEVATDYNLLAPNSFTPNADGINDDFVPEALKVLDVDFEMTIYDKRGLVYQTRSLNDPWTGYNQRDGGQCPQGAYAWIVKYKDHEGQDQIYRGTINLLK